MDREPEFNWVDLLLFIFCVVCFSAFCVLPIVHMVGLMK
jgi:hypothetical protein